MYTKQQLEMIHQLIRYVWATKGVDSEQMGSFLSILRNDTERFIKELDKPKAE